MISFNGGVGVLNWKLVGLDLDSEKVRLGKAKW